MFSEMRGLKMKFELKKVYNRILLVLVIIQFLIICIVNFTRSYHLLDYDSSLAIRHAVEMWDKGLFLDNYTYTTSLEIDSVPFFAAPIFRATGNLNLSLGIVHLVFYGIFFYILYDIIRRLKLSSDAFLLGVLMIFTPYTYGQLEWSNMLFISAGQYEFRVLLVFVLFDVLLVCRTKKFYQSYIGISGMILTFWVSLSSGNYILYMVLFPCILQIGYGILKRQRINWKSNENLMIIVYILVAIIGWRIRDSFVDNFQHSNFTLISAKNFISNFFNCILGVFLLLGGVSGIEKIDALSIQGIAALTRLFFTGGCIIFSIVYFARKEKVENIEILVEYMLAVFGVNIFVLLAINTKYGSEFFEYRYHLMWIVLWIFFIAVLIGGELISYINKWTRCFLQYGVLLLLFLINISGFWNIFHYGNLEQIAKFLKYANVYDAEIIYLGEWPAESHILRVFDMERYYASFSWKDEMMKIDTYDYYQYDKDNYNDDVATLLICDMDMVNMMPRELMKEYDMVGSEPEYVVYYAPNNYIREFCK